MKSMKSTKNYLVICIVLLQALFNVQTGYGQIINDGRRYASNSKLAKGKWIKIKVKENAIYKLTYEQLDAWGLNPDSTKVYGYGGWPLTEDFTQPYLDDLPEVACWKSGPTAEFNPGEFLLFYGRGVVKWRYNSTGKNYLHENNPYSTYGVYFLSDDATTGPPKRMETISLLSNPSAVDVDSFEDYMLHEKEEVSIAQSGRELYGENFMGKGTLEFPFRIPGILNPKASIALSFASKVLSPTNLSLSVNDNSNVFYKYMNANISIPTVGVSMSPVAVAYENTVSWDCSKNENTIIKIEHPCGMTAAHLNYIRLNMTRTLQYYDTCYTFFRNSDNLSKSIRFKIGNANQNLLVFDVTNNYDTKLMGTNFDGIDTLSFDIAKSSSVREFVLVDTTKVGDFQTPDKIEEIDNQNLHKLGQIDMIIISPEAFLSDAKRLALKHSNLKVEVVTPEQVYNEFSSGTPDATAYRRFMKMFYDRGKYYYSNLPRYLLLFGDGVYDNRFLDTPCQSLNKDNFLLTYQVKESLKLDESYLCDDYFGFLDEYEEIDEIGRVRTSNEAKKLMLGIGRIPVQTTTAAKNIVDKIISYMDNKDYGIWKNSVVFLADDSDTNTAGNQFTLHMLQADSVAKSILQKNYPEYMVTKVYMDAFKSEMSGGKKTYNTTAKKKFWDAVNDGCFVLNYSGHGGVAGLAHEVVTIPDITNMNNKHLPFWVASTCEIAEFDAITSSMGEEIFLREKSGVIGLFSSTRVVYAHENVKMHYAVIQNLFAKKSGKRPTLGDVVKEAKNSLEPHGNKLNYILLGDPALILNYPEYQVVVDQVNNNPVSGGPFSLKALEHVTIKGSVKKDGIKDSSFNGSLGANVFDGMQKIQTVTMTTANTFSYFTDYPSLISSTYCNVVNGEFEFDFTVMKDIAGSSDLGKMNMYAHNNSGKEANGSFMNYSVNGIDASYDPEDTTAPTIISIHLNDISYTNPSIIVNATPYFAAKVSDTKGINISGAGIGHNITLIINNSPAMTYNLNAFYKASTTESNTGTISFAIPALPEGKHTLTFRVWNILNNVAVESFEFEVKNHIPMYDLTVNPNPAKIGGGTIFDFTHNKPEIRGELSISVFDLSGRLVWSYNKTGASDLMSIHAIPWDLKNDTGVDVQPGIYLYNACIKNESGIETTKTKKMIVVRQ